MEIGADGSFLHIFAGYMVRGKLGRQVLQKNEKRAYWGPVNLNCPQCKRHINVPSSAEGSMVNCSKCGHEFLCDREKLIPKKPFAKAKKAVSVHSPKDRREAIQSALVETGLIQLVCLCASLAVAAGCVWIFYNASSEMDGTFFLSMLQQPQQKAFALFFACLAGGLMACARLWLLPPAASGFFTMLLPRWMGPFSFPCCSSPSRRRSPCFLPVLPEA